MSFRTGPVIPPELITYRMGKKYVYVAPAPNYEEAVCIALKEFPDELGDVPRENIMFTVPVKTTQGEQRTVRISESAWAPAVARLLRGDVVDVEVRKAELKGGDNAPPQYLDVPEWKSRSPSPSPTPRSRSPSPRSKPKGFLRLSK